MIKYSLQNECLENIEAFSDEQMNREMAVIESVLEIYDKTILMMELSNNDVDIPDCSMFMESTFFQEDGDQPAENSQTTEGGNPAPPTEGQPQPDTQNNDNQNNNNNTQKTPPTEAERKKYNSEHQFRQMNKKGNIENMFISIITFIPRFFGFLIQTIVKFFKKKKNNKATENAKNATPEERAKVAEELKKNEGSTVGDVKIENGEITASTTVTGKDSEEQVRMSVDGDGNITINTDLDAGANAVLDATSQIVQQYEDPKKALTSEQPINFDVNNVKQRTADADKAYAERRQKESIEAFEGKRAQVLHALENRFTELRKTETNLVNYIKILEHPHALKGYNFQQLINVRKTDLETLKTVIELINRKIKKLNAIDVLTNKTFEVYNEYLTKTKDIVNGVNNDVAHDIEALNQAEADAAAGKTPSAKLHMHPMLGKGPKEVKNNGGENQNNQPNAG